MKTVLFINHTKKNCGVYQYGIRVYDILKQSNKINFVYKEISDYDEYLLSLQINNVREIIYNYHYATLNWLNINNISKNHTNIGIIHESPTNIFDITCDIDPDIQDTIKNISIPRPIFENVETMLDNMHFSSETIQNFIQYSEENTPIFGSFGFGFYFKGFDKIVKIINEQYDNAIIKLVIPIAYFDPESQFTVINARNKCIENNKKSGIKLMITHEFMTNEELLKFLSSNTLNIFLYDTLNNRGISSVIDYALSVKKPLAISDSHMFKHIYSDEICVYKNNIEYILENSTKYCEKYLVEFSNKNLINVFETIIDNSIKKYSQANQDIFVSKICNKRDGFFLEIGSNHPITHNNTYLLEKEYNWKGLMVEYDKIFENLYKIHRSNSIYELNDARIINYRKILDDYNFPSNMDYLQIDLDVNNKSTLDTLVLLDNTVFDKYKFAIITFEHDIYSGNYFDTRNISRDIFSKRGYILAFPDVKVFWENEYKPFEDWYIHPDLININIIDEIKTNESLNNNEIINRLQIL
jgi:hypothetical protein